MRSVKKTFFCFAIDKGINLCYIIISKGPRQTLLCRKFPPAEARTPNPEKSNDICMGCVSNIWIAEGFLSPSVLRDDILTRDGAISEEVIGPLPNNKYYVSNGVLIQY